MDSNPQVTMDGRSSGRYAFLSFGSQAKSVAPPPRQAFNKFATRERSTSGVTSLGVTAVPATKPTLLNTPRRNGLLIAAPSAREK